MISAILGVAGAYSDNLSYHHYPEGPNGAGKYNSNGFIHGLLDAVTTSRPDISWSGWVDSASHPGWATTRASAY
jgi:hypothetical protein